LPPGEKWVYNGGLSILLGEVVRSISGEYIDKFAESFLFGPLGINRYFWFKHANGTVYTNGDLLLTPRDLAKIGLLVQNGGEWQGRQIVSRQWIAESTRRQVSTGEFDYGYHWWIGNVARDDRRFKIIFGSGTGGQKLFIVPEMNLVVVITAQVFGNSGGHVGAYRILSDYIIPASLPPRPKLQTSSSNASLTKAVSGKYQIPTTDQFLRIVYEQDRLYLKPTFFSRVALTQVGDHRFVGHWNHTGTIQIDFHFDSAETVTGLTANFLLRDRIYLKVK
jgi:CubicO group peptidase (beta-lactamase class C family)